ncbi:MAG: hypothetical protein PHY13_10020 [Clostridia bacterium]|jgi:DHA3 family macrolide efflux protein-like MFS transporter|nr:hypothetical protein [Clostridia bacterium]
MVQTSITTIIQENTEESMQGKIFGFLNAMYSGCLPIGMAVFGPLSDVVSLRLLMIITGSLMAIIAFFVNYDKSIKSN